MKGKGMQLSLLPGLFDSQGDSSHPDRGGGDVSTLPAMTSQTSNYHIQKSELIPLYQQHARDNNLDWMLLRAIAIKESSENPNAVNRADPSYGLMQILYKLDDQGQPNKLNVKDWPPLYTSQLFDPDYSLHIGAQILAWNMKNYGYLRGIAIYNAWEARKSPVNGPFPNQNYVDKVLGYYRQIQQENGIYAVSTA